MPLVHAADLMLPGRLQPASIALAAGELVCVAGPNGSGKTSLLHALAGIGRPRGRVSIDGVDPWSAAPSVRARLLSYLPASRDIAWPLTARDLIDLGRVGAGDEAGTERLLAMLGLEALIDRRADHLSTGERARVLIARALVAEPKLLLLDEPTANLDPLWQLRMMGDLRQRTKERGQAALIAVHDLDLARRYADRMIIMNDGHIAADGPPDILLVGPLIPAIFGVEQTDQGWRLAEIRRADRRSSR
jgi:iron complex transport system ATP-binding protein